MQDSVIKQILDKEAYERLSNIQIVRPDRYEAIKQSLMHVK